MSVILDSVPVLWTRSCLVPVPKTTHHSGPKDYRPMAPYITHHEDPGETHPGPATAHGQPFNAGVPNPRSPNQYQSVDYLVPGHKENILMALSSKDDGTSDGKPTQDGSEEHSELEEEQVRQRVPKVDKKKTMVNSYDDDDDDDGTEDWKPTQDGSEDFSEEEEKHGHLQREMSS